MLYDIIVLRPSTMFYVVTVSCDMWQMCDITLTPNPKSKNDKINENENKNKNKNKNEK